MKRLNKYALVIVYTILMILFVLNGYGAYSKWELAKEALRMEVIESVSVYEVMSSRLPKYNSVTLLDVNNECVHKDVSFPRGSEKWAGILTKGSRFTLTKETWTQNKETWIKFPYFFEEVTEQTFLKD